MKSIFLKTHTAVILDYTCFAGKLSNHHEDMSSVWVCLQLGQSNESVKQEVAVLADDRSKWSWLANQLPSFIATGKVNPSFDELME